MGGRAQSEFSEAKSPSDRLFSIWRARKRRKRKGTLSPGPLQKRLLCQINLMARNFPLHEHLCSSLITWLSTLDFSTVFADEDSRLTTEICISTAIVSYLLWASGGVYLFRYDMIDLPASPQQPHAAPYPHIRRYALLSFL